MPMVKRDAKSQQFHSISNNIVAYGPVDAIRSQSATSQPKQTRRWALSADDVMFKVIGSQITLPSLAN